MDRSPTPEEKKKLRTGFTTGACAAAAAKAATRALVRGAAMTEIETTLPNKQKVTFALKRCERVGDSVVCSIIKDAGDDPDVTHGVLVVATVRRAGPGAGVSFKAGEGVGTVTRPGLPLPVGEVA